MSLLALLITGVAALIALQTVFLLLLVITAYRDRPSTRDSSDPESDARSVVLIPAHNESAVIDRTLKSIGSQLGDNDSVCVVADNCTDNTADMVRTFAEDGHRVNVLERTDPDNRGKGFALDYGVQHLAQNPPDIVIIVDADCSLEADCLSLLKAEASSLNLPVQANYLLHQSANASLVSKVSAFALVLKNVVRQRGTRALNIPCIMVGAGMAFPWQALTAIPLASGNIVEDMQMGVDLAIAGYPPRYCDGARVRSVLPEESQTALKQRTRWEHGHLSTLLTQVPLLLRAAIVQRRADLVGHALDLSIPPLSLLIALWTGVSAVALVVFLMSGTSAALLLSVVAGVAVAAAGLLTWHEFGRDILSPTELLTIPMYLLWKLPLYFRFLTKREKSWVRTSRETSPDGVQAESPTETPPMDKQP